MPAEFAAHTVELALLVEHHADGRLSRRLQQPVARPLGFHHGLRPLAVQLHDLRAVNETLTTEGRQVGLGLVPVAQRRGPLVRASQIEGLLAAQDDRAVHPPSHERRNPFRRDRDHRLVEQGESLVSAAHPDQRRPLPEQAPRHEVRLAVPPADLGGSEEPVPRPHRVARLQRPQRERHEEVAPLHALLPVVVELPARPGEPPAAAGRLHPAEQLERQPERAPHSRCRLVTLQVRQCARSHAAAGTPSSPTRYAATASRCRSSGASGPSPSAADSCA